MLVMVVADGTSRARRRAGATACGTTCPSTSALSKLAAATTARATSGPSTPPTWTTSPRATTTAGGRAGASAGEPGWFGEKGGGQGGVRVVFGGLRPDPVLCFPSQAGGEHRLLPPLRPVRPRLLLPLLPPAACRAPPGPPGAAPPGPARCPPPLPARASAVGTGPRPPRPRPLLPRSLCPLPVALCLGAVFFFWGGPRCRTCSEGAPWMPPAPPWDPPPKPYRPQRGRSQPPAPHAPCWGPPPFIRVTPSGPGTPWHCHGGG